MSPEQSNSALLLQWDWDDEPTAAPRLRQLENGLREAIRAGRLRSGVRLPASRALSEQIGCSRWMVVQAYEQLEAEGYLRSQVGSGTYVQGVPTAEPTPPPVRKPDRSYTFDFRTGIPDLSKFPRTDWLRAARTGFAKAPSANLDYGDPDGLPALRGAIADYLGRVRGAAALEENTFVTNGAVHAVGILAGTLAARGIRRIGVEDPGWIPLRLPFEGSEVEPVPIRVDDEGVSVDGLREAGVAAVLVSPAHSFPVGSVMSRQRRLELLRWADEVGGLIIEDDYDAELRYDRQPLGVLQGVVPERVALVGSVSKSLAPGLRLGWLVTPSILREEVRTSRSHIDVGISVFSQLTFGEFVSSGAFERHLRQMRREYAHRREILIEALAESFPGVTVTGTPAGLHALVQLATSGDQDRLQAELDERSVRAYPLHRYCHAGELPARYRPGLWLVLGFGAISMRRIPDGVRAIAEAVRASS
ncbi:MAG: PLP-dependent aminotransferase family protein [Micromonosporaceae bacterium]